LKQYKMDNGKIVTALLAGLAAGAVLGILFAPEKGSETRDKLNDSLADLGDAIKERAEEQINQLSEFKDKILSAVNAKVAHAEDILEEEIEEHAYVIRHSFVTYLPYLRRLCHLTAPCRIVNKNLWKNKNFRFQEALEKQKSTLIPNWN